MDTDEEEETECSDSSSSIISSEEEETSDSSSTEESESESESEDDDKEDEEQKKKEKEKKQQIAIQQMEMDIDMGDEEDGFYEEMNNMIEDHVNKSQEEEKMQSTIKTQNILKQLIKIIDYNNKNHKECKMKPRRNSGNGNQYCNPKCLVDFIGYTKKKCQEEGLDSNIYYCQFGRFHDCSEICPGDLNNAKQQPHCSKTGKPKSYMFTSCESWKEEESFKNIRKGRKVQGQGQKWGRNKLGGKTKMTIGVIPPNRNRGRSKQKKGRGYEETPYSEQKGHNRYYACKECSRLRDEELNKPKISESIQMKKRKKKRTSLKKNIQYHETSKRVIRKKTRLKKSTKRLIFSDNNNKNNRNNNNNNKRNEKKKNRRKREEEEEIKVIKGFELYKNMFIGNSNRKVKIKRIQKTLRICTLHVPIRINNDVSDKQTNKLKDLFKYPIFFLSRTIFYFLKSRVTLEQLLIQTRTLSFSKMFENGCNRMFDAYYRSSDSSMDVENSVIENAKKFLKEYIDVMTATERVGLLGLWPGIHRIVVDMKNLPDGYTCLFGKAKKYIEYCRERNMPIDMQTYFYLTDADAQIQNETNLQDLYKAHESPEKLHEFWYTTTTNIRNRSKTVNYVDWPTFDDLQKWDIKTLAIYILVKFSGASNYKRKTVDPIEIAIVSSYLFFKGASKWFPNRSHVTYIPKDFKLSQPGYVLYYNQLGKTLGIKGCSKSHIQGESLIDEWMKWVSKNGEDVEGIVDMIQNFVIQDPKKKRRRRRQNDIILI